jgi:alanyl-tRNA synthetase
MEEERFLLTLNEGLKKVAEIIADIRDKGSNIIPGAEAFMLYDTYGFPLDLTEDVAEENKLQVDTEGFNRMMEEQRERLVRPISPRELLPRRLLYQAYARAKCCFHHFTGYEKTPDQSSIIAIIKGDVLVEQASDEKVLIVTAQTPFYAESGGQVADSGLIIGQQGRMQVENVQKVGNIIVHEGKSMVSLLVVKQLFYKSMKPNEWTPLVIIPLPICCIRL